MAHVGLRAQLDRRLDLLLDLGFLQGSRAHLKLHALPADSTRAAKHADAPTALQTCCECAQMDRPTLTLSSSTNYWASVAQGAAGHA